MDDRIPAAESEGGTGAPVGDGLFDDDSAIDRRRDWTAWSNLWQVPAIVVSVALIGVGIWMANRRAPQEDFGGGLAQVERLIDASMFPDAQSLLEGPLLENLELATQSERALYHALIGDWLSASQAAAGASTPTNNQAIHDQYSRAVELGLVPTPLRLERWAYALIDLGRVDLARARMSELEAIGFSAADGGAAHLRRNRILRRLVEHSLTAEDLDYDAVIEELEAYRSDPVLKATDRAWVLARQAELRLESGEAAQAVERLLVAMRRLEDDADRIDAETWSEMYLLLGRGYYEQGIYDHARFHLDEAMRRLEPSQSGRAEVLLYLGRVNLAENQLESAFARFDEIGRNYINTRAELPALVGRSEIQSILGDHEASLTGYRSIIEQLQTAAAPRRDVTDRSVAASLADRHDAALMRGDLPLALEYVSLAEGLFDERDVPIDVLFRIASTSRQIADDLMNNAIADLADRPVRVEHVDPEIRHLARTKYERAGAAFLRHARMLTALPAADREWADSLWLSADSYDLAGRRDLAIKYFAEYIGGRSIDDPRRAEVTFRLAQAHEADSDFEAAVRQYQQVIAEHPRSPFGTRSHVPLARCFVALDRAPDAERQLVEVVEGRQGEQTPIMPDAVDYRDALIELGGLYYETDRPLEAIERLTAAVTRYPDDERIHETRFRLADSHRRRSLDLRAELEAGPALSPEERLSRQQLSREHLERAMDLFSMVSDGYSMLVEGRLNRLQRDYRRYAMLYRADCAFEMQQYELASALYDQAARRYSDHHSSMHALVQIVNCYDRLGRQRDADIAHHNALIRLRQLPEDAFDDPQSLMDRTAWEQWLQNRPLGRLNGSETASSG